MGLISRRETQTYESLVSVPTGTMAGLKEEKEVKVQFFFICVMLHVKLSNRPRWLERETWIREPPDPLPTGTTTSSLAGLEIKVRL